MTGDGTLNTPQAPADGGGELPAGAPLILDQHFDGDSLYALRATLEAHVAQAGLPEGRASDLIITVHELATNAVLHGAGAGRVRLWRQAGTLHCQVSDEGRAKAGERSAGRPADQWPYEHGHGLWIARYLADRLTVRSASPGSVVTVAFELPRDDRLPRFSLVRHARPSHVELALSGDLDQQAAQEVGAAVQALLSEHPAPRLVLDLTEVTFWDAIGIAALVTAQQRVNETSAGVMFVAGLSEEFRQRLTALSPTGFTFCDGPEHAAKQLPPPDDR
ncbi:ATP-binding protein [Nonomuraea dietziae]|uniref:ATP-binding protein n=1 Tax=Nonomuraea dietziae TaxID=65515 RepID=UPI0034383450